MEKKKLSQTEIIREMDSLNFRNQRAWFRMFELLTEVENRELYKEGFPADGQSPATLVYMTGTFSSWISAYCDNSKKISRARAREILRAGEILSEFLERQGKSVEDLDVMPAPQTLVNISNFVSRKNAQPTDAELDYYINEAASGRLSRDKTREMLKGLAGSQESREMSFKMEIPEMSIKQEMKDFVAKNGNWLDQKWHEGIYKGFSNFSLPSGKKEVVVFEDLDKDEIACNLILVAPEQQDLMTVQDDLKMSEAYFDYTWLMVAGENDLDNFELPSGVGILEYKPFDIKIKKPAERNAKSDTNWAFREYVKRVH